MKEFFNPIKTDNLLSKSFIYSSVILFIVLIFLIIRFFSLPPFIPVFNQMPWGNERIGPTIFIFIPLLTSIFIISTNTFISAYIYAKSPILSRIFAITSILCAFLTLIFSLVIVTIISR